MSKDNLENQYSADSIQALEGMEHVRKRPSTVKLESLLISRDIEVQYPAIASSIELSTTS